MKNIETLPFYEVGKTGTIEFLGVSYCCSGDCSKAVILYKYEGQIIADCKTITDAEKEAFETLILETPEEVDNVSAMLNSLDVKDFKMISEHGECEFEIINSDGCEYLILKDDILGKVILGSGASFDFNLYNQQFEYEDEPAEKQLIRIVQEPEWIRFIKSKF